MDSTAIEPINNEVGFKYPKFHGTTGDYFKIWIVNILLTIVTFGIYSAWAKVRNLKYFYNSTELEGSRFDFYGLPAPILKGRIIAFLVFIFYFASSQLHIILAIMGLIVMYFAIPWMFVKSMKFKLGYSGYRNIRFSFRGKIKEAYKIYFKYTGIFFVLIFLNICLMKFFGISAGQTKEELAKNPKYMTYSYVAIGMGLIWVIALLKTITPFYNQILNFIYNNIYYGGAKASITSDSKSLYKKVVGKVLARYLLMTLLFVAGILLVAFSGLAKTFVAPVAIVFYFAMLAFIPYALGLVIDYIWNNLKLETHESNSKLKIMEYVKLIVVNTLAMGLSLGLLYPWAKIRQKNMLLKVEGLL